MGSTSHDLVSIAKFMDTMASSTRQPTGGPSPRDDRAPARDATGSGPEAELEILADRLHSAAIHLLRRLRREDAASGLTASRLSALSVVVFAGPIRIGELAAAEQVRAPTISRLVTELEGEGLVRRRADQDDGRVQLVEPTAAGRRLLERGRRRRVAALAAELERLDPADRTALARAAEVLEEVALPRDHPHHGG